MASVSLRHIFKKYPGGVTAVSDFNLEIKDKEFLVLVGSFRLRKIDNPAYDCGSGGNHGR